MSKQGKVTYLDFRVVETGFEKNPLLRIYIDHRNNGCKLLSFSLRDADKIFWITAHWVIPQKHPYRYSDISAESHATIEQWFAMGWFDHIPNCGTMAIYPLNVQVVYVKNKFNSAIIRATLETDPLSTGPTHLDRAHRITMFYACKDPVEIYSYRLWKRRENMFLLTNSVTITTLLQQYFWTQTNS